MSNFKDLENGLDSQFGGRGDRHLHDIHDRIQDQQGIFRLVADVAELFIPQTFNTFFKMFGSDDDAIKPRQAPADPFDLPGNIPGGRG